MYCPLTDLIAFLECDPTYNTRQYTVHSTTHVSPQLTVQHTSAHSSQYNIRQHTVQHTPAHSTTHVSTQLTVQHTPAQLNTTHVSTRYNTRQHAAHNTTHASTQLTVQHTPAQWQCLIPIKTPIAVPLCLSLPPSLAHHPHWLTTLTYITHPVLSRGYSCWTTWLRM